MIQMNSDEFSVFKNRSIQNLAEQIAEDFGLSQDQAITQANEKFNSYLPLGLKTTGHDFYQIKDASGNPCGYLWYGERLERNKRSIFIYDILVEEQFRGRGYAKWMLGWLENTVKCMNIDEITLHVLGYNYKARELYETNGFETTHLYMSKKLLKNC